MPAPKSNLTTVKQLALVGAASAMTLGVSAPAFAGGGHYHGGYYAGGYSHGYYGHHRYRRGRHHHHGGGGKAAAIALGVIGGAIILNEISEDRARQRAYEDRYDRRYNRRYDGRYYDRGAYERGYEEGYARGRTVSDEPIPAELEDDLDAQLKGGRIEDGGPEPIRVTYAAAYDACTVHARAALAERGFMLAAPAEPETAEDAGRGWKMTANVTAQNQRGESWSRAMYCEADAGRVYLLELI